MRPLIAALACGLTRRSCNQSNSLATRDGRLGATPQAELYAQRCGASIDREKYEAGWHAGRAQRPSPPV